MRWHLEAHFTNKGIDGEPDAGSAVPPKLYLFFSGGKVVASINNLSKFPS